MSKELEAMMPFFRTLFKPLLKEVLNEGLNENVINFISKSISLTDKPTIKEACAYLQISRRTFDKRVLEGRIILYENESADGRQHCDREQIMKLYVYSNKNKVTT